MSATLQFEIIRYPQLRTCQLDLPIRGDLCWQLPPRQALGLIRKFPPWWLNASLEMHHIVGNSISNNMQLYSRILHDCHNWRAQSYWSWFYIILYYQHTEMFFCLSSLCIWIYCPLVLFSWEAFIESSLMWKPERVCPLIFLWKFKFPFTLLCSAYRRWKHVKWQIRHYWTLPEWHW